MSLDHILLERARRTPHRPAYTFLNEKGDAVDHRTFENLLSRANTVARRLAGAARAGERIALMYQPGLDFLDAFFGCILGGFVAVPMMAPRPKGERTSTVAILRKSGAKVIATTEVGAESLSRRLVKAGYDGAAEVVTTDQLDQLEACKTLSPSPDEVAFLQFTSGSTSTPKGVVIRHSNVIANCEMIAAKMAQDESCDFVGWTPLYHDQGLVGNVIQPLFLGSHAILMAPNTFLQRPLLWLEAISRYRAHTSGGPDYAFGLVADRLFAGTSAQLDLSSWRVAFNGAEPIRPAILTRFIAAAAPYGFSPRAMYPCYGLAEATLFSTGAMAGKGAVIQSFDRAALANGALEPQDDGVDLVSCGRPAPGIDLAIVDIAEQRLAPQGRIGEIWIGGESVASSYWEDEATSENVFGQHLDGRPRPYLRTGDLGALMDGELYVCGRLKDLIIVCGRNIYPQDLEATARSVDPALAAGSAAAVEVHVEGSRQLLLAVEVDRAARRSIDVAELKSQLRLQILKEHDVMLDRVALVRPGALPKTSSGKIQRRAVACVYEAGELQEITGDVSLT